MYIYTLLFTTPKFTQFLQPASEDLKVLMETKQATKMYRPRLLAVVISV